MKKIDTLLVANRGEIALRVMRTAAAMGMRTVAIYSTADADAPHVRFADDAVCVGPAPVADSYLRAEAVLAAAKSSGADAVHPGYGFLSENAGFAEAVSAQGLVFVGPPAQAIEIMGDKAVSKRRMQASSVPCIPGYEGEDQSDETLLRAAAEIGYPLMVKAAAGGGGRGMRLVERAEDLPDALTLARSEAENAFGSGVLILEKAIVAPRHVEVQVFADSHGHTIFLGERDCSVQRRHQKVIEEAPCPVMTQALRARMGAAAVDAARAVDYCGAGTVEFLLDDQCEFYFLEMNTRLQVEHPVTELITGLDLVELQLQVAQGYPLELEQHDVQLNGHAIEVRLYAEDPAQDFLPSTGPVLLWQPPHGSGVRVDDGIITGGDVSPFYDSMVAKIIAHGGTRDQALRRLSRALHECALFGVRSNRDFLIDALNRPGFAAGQATTAFIAEVYGDDGYQAAQVSAPSFAVAAVLQHSAARTRAHSKAVGVADELLDWSSTADLTSIAGFLPTDGADGVSVTVRSRPRGAYQCMVADQQIDVELIELDTHHAQLRVAGRTVRVSYCQSGEGGLWLAMDGQIVLLADPAAAGDGAAAAANSGEVRAPMHGLLLDLLVAPGAQVNAGDRLAVLEAMKMQHELFAQVTGEVVQVLANAGDQVAADDLLLEIQPADDSTQGEA